MFRILILFLESKFLFSAHISPFYVIIYNSKTWIGILNTALGSKLKLEVWNKIWAYIKLQHKTLMLLSIYCAWGSFPLQLFFWLEAQFKTKRSPFGNPIKIPCG